MVIFLEMMLQMKMEIENLSIKEIIKKKAHTEIIYNITE